MISKTIGPVPNEDLDYFCELKRADSISQLPGLRSSNRCFLCGLHRKVRGRVSTEKAACATYGTYHCKPKLTYASYVAAYYCSNRLVPGFGSCA